MPPLSAANFSARGTHASLVCLSVGSGRDDHDEVATDELKGEIRSFLGWLLGVAPELRAQLPPEWQASV